MYRINVPGVVSPRYDLTLMDFADTDYPKDALGRPEGSQIVDNFEGQDFNLAENGFRMSDIVEMFKAESAAVQDSIAANMVEIRSNPAAEGLSDHELAQMAIPRCCQSPAALTDWMASLETSGISKTVDDFIARQEEKAAKLAETEAKLAELEELKKKAKSVEPKIE